MARQTNQKSFQGSSNINIDKWANTNWKDIWWNKIIKKGQILQSFKINIGRFMKILTFWGCLPSNKEIDFRENGEIVRMSVSEDELYALYEINSLIHDF